MRGEEFDCSLKSYIRCSAGDDISIAYIELRFDRELWFWQMPSPGMLLQKCYLHCRVNQNGYIHSGYDC